MKILILDDERVRHDAFDTQYGGCEVWHAYDLEQFKNAIRKVGKFDVIQLDHDLGLRVTGVDAAEYVISLSTSMVPELCVVHSWNRDGARAIASRLHAAGISVRIHPFAARR